MVLSLISNTAESAAHANNPEDVLATDAVEQMADMMSSYGIITVIMGAFLLIVLALVAYLIINDRKRSKSMMDLLDHQTTELEKRDKKNQELIEKLTIDREEKEKEEQTEKNLVAIFIKLNLVLKEECRILQEKLNCNRVGIYVYHNGSKSLSGLPFFKTTCISEWLTKKLLMKTKLHEHTDVPLGMFYNLVSGLFVDGHFIIKNRDDIKDTEPVTYERLCQLCAKSSILISVKNKDESDIGCIVIEFDDILTSDEQVNKIIEDGKDLASKISLLLDYSLYSKDDIEEISKDPFGTHHPT